MIKINEVLLIILIGINFDVHSIVSEKLFKITIPNNVYNNASIHFHFEKIVFMLYRY